MFDTRPDTEFKEPTRIGLSWPRFAREVARRGRVRKVPPGEPARYMAPTRGSFASVASGGGGAFVAASPRSANSRAFVLYRAMR